jgi:hypothetical protein
VISVTVSQISSPWRESDDALAPVKERLDEQKYDGRCRRADSRIGQADGGFGLDGDMRGEPRMAVPRPGGGHGAPDRQLHQHRVLGIGAERAAVVRLHRTEFVYFIFAVA